MPARSRDAMQQETPPGLYPPIPPVEASTPALSYGEGLG